MIPVIEQYRAGIAKHLRCCKDIKAHLLDSFDKNMLFPLLEASNHPSGEELHTAFGTPAEVAALLMEQLTAEEAMRYRRQQKQRKTFAIGAAAIVIAVIMLFVAYVFFEKEFSNITFDDSGPYNMTSNESD